MDSKRLKVKMTVSVQLQSSVNFVDEIFSFPIDTPLVLRLVKTHMGKCLFSPELKSYLITQ